MDKGKPEVKGPKVKKPEEEVETIYYNKVCPEKTCYLIPKIINLLFPYGYGSDEWEAWRRKITSGNIYIYIYVDLLLHYFQN